MTYGDLQVHPGSGKLTPLSVGLKYLDSDHFVGHSKF